MPGLTRTACKTRIRELLAEPTARHFPETSLNTWIDDAVRDVSIKTFCSTKIVTTAITTTSGVKTYAWPTNMGTTAIATIGIKTIITSNNVSLDYVTPEQIGRIPAAGIDNMKWTSWNEQIVLSHVPTATLTLTPYIWIESRITAAGTLPIPNAYHHVVPLYGVYMGHMKRLRLEAAKFAFEMYQNELNRIASIINPAYIPTPMKEGIQDIGETP